MTHTDKIVRIDSRQTRESGFTLLEMMAVVAILLVLLALGAARYDLAVVRAKESALAQDLAEMNKAIQNYTLDREAAPQTLDDLVTARYLGRIPDDPVTGINDWVTETCDDLLSADQTVTGICSVHSGSDKVSPFTNKPYSTWTSP